PVGGLGQRTATAQLTSSVDRPLRSSVDRSGVSSTQESMIRGPDRSDSADDANGTESALGAALREIGIRELGALAQDHRALVQRLRATGRVDGSELRLHERIASHLFA